MNASQLRYRTTTAQFEVVQEGRIELRLTFYVSAVREEITGRWKLMRVLVKDLAAFFDPRQGSEFVMNGAEIVAWFKREHAEPSGAVTDNRLTHALDTQEASDDAAGKCFVPC